MSSQQQPHASVLPFRSGRFFNVNGEWYFATRESLGHGPFTDRATAEEACCRYVLGKRRRNRVRRVG